jgi:hypothetical protein
MVNFQHIGHFPGYGVQDELNVQAGCRGGDGCLEREQLPVASEELLFSQLLSLYLAAELGILRCELRRSIEDPLLQVFFEVAQRFLEALALGDIGPGCLTQRLQLLVQFSFSLFFW